MAKGQKRSNREIKKPKAAKAPMEVMQSAGSGGKSTLERIAPTKNKH